MAREDRPGGNRRALRPADLRRIALDALRRFYDFGLEQRSSAAAAELAAEARKRVNEHPAWPEAKGAIENAYAAFQTAAEEVLRAQQAAVDKLRVGLDDITKTIIKPPAP